MAVVTATEAMPGVGMAVGPALTAFELVSGRNVVERLSGKVAIVSGAASRGEGVGNGAATAVLFAREGAKVVLVNRSLERAKVLEEQIRSEGGEATACPTDITQPEAVEAMAAFAVERYGRLDILHNNVGIGASVRRRRSIWKNGIVSCR